MKQKMIIMGPPESRSKQRKVGIAAYLPPPGAIKVPCDRCGDKMWIGPRQQSAKADAPETEVVCSVCGLAVAKSEGIGIAHLGGAGGSYGMTDGASYGPDYGTRN
jgi:ribosomal protein S27E